MSSSPSDPEVSTLIAQLNALKQNTPTDTAKRQELYDATRSLLFALETPGEAIERIAYTPQQTVTARLASDVGLFEILASKSGSSVNTAELAKMTKMDETLLARISRYLASFGMISEAGEDLWSANSTTKTLSVPGMKAGLHHFHDVIMPCWQAMPEFFAETEYQNPTDNHHSPFQKGHRTDLVPFPFLQKAPEYLKNFNMWMTSHHVGQNIFLDVFPFEKEVALSSTPDTPLFVDVGGGFGHQCVAVKKRFPHVPGRVILQDLPAVIAHAVPAEGVQHMGHDFMDEQPIKGIIHVHQVDSNRNNRIIGARAYYMRNVLHDWPDDRCVAILQPIVKAMGSDSVILIDDMIIPNIGAHWRATQLDLLMMSSLAAVERTEKQWYALMDMAGLKIRQIYTYTPELRDSIIVAVPK